MKADTKPNGRKHGVWVISIDDGYVEWSYDMNIGGINSIAGIERRIRRLLKCNTSIAKMRRVHKIKVKDSP